MTWGRIRGASPEKVLEGYGRADVAPVAVEVKENAEPLTGFDHPEEAVYVFGPEDGSVPKSVLARCHRFVRIPGATRTPLNLAAAVNVVLYDRRAKQGRR